MTTAEIAKDFTELLKQGNNEAAAEKYNADNVVSYEAMEGPMAVCEGKDAVKQKGGRGPLCQRRPVRGPLQV